MKTTIPILMLVLPVVGCASQAVAESGAQTAIESAKALQQEAEAINGAWVTTDELISEAEAALAKGNEKQALTLAEKAQKEAKLAHAQAERQREHWSEPAYLKK